MGVVHLLALSFGLLKGVWAIRTAAELDVLQALNDSARTSVVAVGHDQAPPVANYWDVEKGMTRCQAVRAFHWWKNGMKIVVGAPVIFAVGGGAMQGVTKAITYAACPGCPVEAGALQGRVPSMIMGRSLAKAVAVGAAWGSFKITNAAIEKIGEVFRGQRHPICCCNVTDAGEKSCDLKGTSHGIRGRLRKCPTGMEHHAEECKVPEILSFDTEVTVSHCKCKDWTHCGTKKPWDGHAWCEVEIEEVSGFPVTCGHRFISKPWRRWDYCRYAEEAPAAQDEEAGEQSTSLWKFVPHTETDQGKTWTDGHRGITIAADPENTTDLGKQCFLALPEETLDGCAESCLEEGAPSMGYVDKGDSGDNSGAEQQDDALTYDCDGFAYNRQMHLCARLPRFATKAIYKPYLTRFDGPGWQNFVLESVLEAEALEADAGPMW